jgi:hypothetical protein
LSSETGTPGRQESTTSPINLWVYGKEEHLSRFRDELLEALGEKVAFSESSEFPLAESEAFLSAPIAAFQVRIPDLVGPALYWFDPLVDHRYSQQRPTVVLCPQDPVTAYASRFPAQEEFTMPRIVGRILEHGDAVEVCEDGVYCVEFVFDERAAQDYRIRILRSRVGRVAIVRRRRGDT